MVKQQPSRKAQLLTAARSGCTAAGVALLFLLPAAMLIHGEVLPETGEEGAALAAVSLSAVLTEALFFAKHRAGYIFIPLSALTAALIFLLLGACLPAAGWDFRCLWKALCAMTAGMTLVHFIKMNKNNKRNQKKRAPYYK